jgi:putative glutamine amidotransferase
MLSSFEYVTIGVSGARPDTDSMRAIIARLEAEGLTPYCLYEHGMRCVQSDASKLDAIIFMGNDYDIDPQTYIERYAEGDPRRCVHPKTKSECSTPESHARAQYENALMKAALERGIPLLGICGGMQRLNVLCGGTLHQHIPDIVGHDRHWQSRHGISPEVGSIPVIIPSGTKLAMIARDIQMDFTINDGQECDKVIMENSLRHQSIDQVGSGLRICSMSDATDPRKGGQPCYLVEAIEADPEGPYASQFLLGVQWHPEFSASPIGARIFAHLIAAARDYARTRGDISYI